MEDLRKKSLTEIEVEGKTLEEAVKKAVTVLGVARKMLNIRVLSEEQKGLFGMAGAKPAKISASIKSSPQQKKKA